MNKRATQNKSDKALRTIGEVSTILDLPSHVIRFWEDQFYNLKPVKYNNRRYYSNSNIQILEQIKELLYTEKYSIKEAIKYFKTSPKKAIVSPVVGKVIKEDKETYKSINIESKVSLEEVRDRLIKARDRLNRLLP